MRIIPLFVLLFLLGACWPESISFRDSGGMPVEWKTFTIENLENTAPNCPLSFAPLLTEQLKDGVQNNTRLLLNTKKGAGEVNISGVISNYQVQPIAIQGADNASQLFAQRRQQGVGERGEGQFCKRLKID